MNEKSWNEDSEWRPLYRFGAWCAVAILLLVPVAVAGFVVAPSPQSAEEAFALFAKGAWMGLVGLDVVYMVTILLSGLLLSVLCVALRRTNPSIVAVAFFLNVLAAAIYFASNPAFEMLTLSRAFHGAGTDAERAVWLAVGEGVLASYTGTAYNVSYVLAGASGLLLAIVMLRSDVFSRVTAWLGIVMGVLALVPPTIGSVGMAAAFLYLVPLMPWLVLVAARLFRLSRSSTIAGAEHAAPLAGRSDWLVRGTLGALLAFGALNAFGGGWYGLAGADGVPRKWLEGSVFESYTVPSLFLFVVIGGTLVVAAISVFRRMHSAAGLATFAGVLLLAWIAVQVAIIGYVSWMQPATAAAGIAVLVLGQSLRGTLARHA